MKKYHQSNYQEYLQSDNWKKLRRRAYIRANNLCETCGAPTEAVHHVRYPSFLP